MEYTQTSIAKRQTIFHDLILYTEVVYAFIFNRTWVNIIKTIDQHSQNPSSKFRCPEKPTTKRDRSIAQHGPRYRDY